MDFEGFVCDAAEGGAWMLNSLSSTVAAHGVQVVHEKLVELPRSPGDSPPGFTAVCLLDESHMTAHCYSDRGWLAIDVFTCGGHDPRPIAADIRRQVESRWGARCVQFEVHGRFLHHSLALEALEASADPAPATAHGPVRVAPASFARTISGAARPSPEALRTSVKVATRRSRPVQLSERRGDGEEGGGSPSFGDTVQDAWARYVLLRPGMGFDDLKNSTKLRTARTWSWQERTPGTARTLVLSVAFVSLFALPVLLANPAVLSVLLETAALSREGITPQEFWTDVFVETYERMLGSRAGL